MRRFAVGDRVRIRELGLPGHVRIPFYIRNHVGTVERYCGSYRNPEDLAYGKRDGAEVDLYRVHFTQTALWRDYNGPANDTLELEIYDHWLDAAPASANDAEYSPKVSE